MVKLREAYKKAQEMLKENGIEDFKSDAFFLIEGIYKVKRAELLSDKEVDFKLLEKAIEEAIAAGQASVSLVQRRLSVGYSRAGRLIDQMEERGIIGGYEGAKPRQVLITPEQLMEMRAGSDE